MEEARTYRFGQFTLVLERGALLRDGEELSLRPKSFSVLLHLVEHAGKLQAKRDLIEAIWPDTVVTDDSLTQCLSEIRRVLEDEDHTIVRTVPRRGVIFDAEVTVLAPSVTGGPAAPEPATFARRFGPVTAAAVLAGLAAWLVTSLLNDPGSGSSPEFEPAPSSVAVLPFEDMTPKRDHAWFADGIAEEILNLLSRDGNFEVAPRTSSFRFRDAKRDLGEIGRDLNVAYVLEGSVRLSDDQLRITAQLIDTVAGRAVWSQSLDRPADDLFAVQTELARQVSAALSAGDDVSVRQPPPGSIAVLPFDSLSQQPEDALLGRGIADEILHHLAAYEDLHVVGRTSSFAFQGSDYAMPRIARLLNVGHLLQGSVRRDGERLRITVQMVGADGRQRWSKAFEADDRSLLDLQSRIANAVVVELAPHVTLAPLQEVTPHFEAYRLYLLGKQLFYQRDGYEARNVLRRAVALDGDSADLRAEYAISLIIGESDQDILAQAREHIVRALDLQPGHPRALAAKGLLLKDYQSPAPEDAERYLVQALAGEPRMVDAMNWLAGVLADQERPQEAHDLLSRAVRIDPLHGAIASNLAMSYLWRGEPERGEALLLPLLEMQAPHPYVIGQVLQIRRESGRLRELPPYVHRLVDITSPPGPWSRYRLLESYALLGAWDIVEREEARAAPAPDESLAWAFWARGQFMPARWRGDYAAALSAAETLVGGSDNHLALGDLGLLRALAGHHEASLPLLHSGKADADSEETWLDRRTARAWVLQQTGAPDKSRQLLDELEALMIESDNAGFLRSSNRLYWAAKTAFLRGDEALALDRLGRAVRAGWRDVYVREHDPRWQPLRDDPRFEALMMQAKRDVDGQRRSLRDLPRYMRASVADELE